MPCSNGGGAGGTQPSNNYPLRGTKAEPWEGGVRTAAFVSGGFLPAAQRGTTSDKFFHIADYYPTIAKLAGVDPTDTVVYNGTARPIDGRDMWPVLTGQAADLGREWLPTTNQSLVWNSRWKLITAAPATHWYTQETGWLSNNRTAWPCRARGLPGRNISTQGIWDCMVCSDAEPCLFDIIADPEERTDVAKQHPDIVTRMQAQMPLVNFNTYTDEALLPEEEPLFDCLSAADSRKDWWGGYLGPCCVPKGTMPTPAPSPPSPPPTPHKHGLVSNLDAPALTKHCQDGTPAASIGGWCWDADWDGGGVPPVYVRVLVDGQVVVPMLLANNTRPDLIKTGAPNKEHGFALQLDTALSARLCATTGAAAASTHRVRVQAFASPRPSASTPALDVHGSPACVKAGQIVDCA